MTYVATKSILSMSKSEYSHHLVMQHREYEKDNPPNQVEKDILNFLAYNEEWAKVLKERSKPKWEQGE
jgi:hypothetical protein